MKRRGNTPAASYELKQPVVLLERCDAGGHVLSKPASISVGLLPRVIITDICRIRESWPVGQCSRPTVHKNRVKKIRRGKISSRKSSRMEKTECDMRIEVSADSSQDISTVEMSHDAVSATETSSSDLFVGETYSPAASCRRSPAIDGASIPDAAAKLCEKMLDILTPSSEDVDPSEMCLQDVTPSGYLEGLRNAEEEETDKQDLTLTETVLENTMATDADAYEFAEPVFDNATRCAAVDNEMPMLVSQGAEEPAAPETTVPDTADPLNVFDHMPLLNVEGAGGDLYRQNRDVPLTGNSDMAEHGEVFAVPDHCSASFLVKNPSALLTGLYSDVMLGDICNRSTLLEEEELLATSSGLSVETGTEESMDFCENDFALDELNWNSEQTWPVLLDPIGSGFQVGQGSLNNSLDARDSDDEFKQKTREEFLARNIRWSLHRGSKKKKRINNTPENRHLDKHFKSAVVDDVMVTPDDRKSNKIKPTLSMHQRKDERKGRDKDAAVDIPQDHEQKSRPPKIKQKQVNYLEDQREYKVKPVRNLSLASKHDPRGDCKEETVLEKKANANTNDVRKFDDSSHLSKSLLKSSEAAKLKFSEMRKKKKDLDADERPKKVEKVLDIKDRCRDEKCSSPAQPNSIFCSSECLARHVEESLRLLAHEREKSFNNRNKIPAASAAGKSVERIVVFERKTGKLVTGPLAPTESSLLTWLQHHPTFEVLQPSCSSRNSKARPSCSGRSKTSPARDWRKKQPLTKNKEDILGRGSDSTTQKGEKKEADVNTNCRVSKARSDALSSTELKKDDLESLKTKTQSELCHLLMTRLKGKASSTKVKNLASDIHYELWSLCKNSSTVYKQKASSLLRIFKRSSSQDLSRRVLSSEVKPRQLVQNLADYLHSEIMSKNTGNVSVADHSGLTPGLSDTTDRHESHVFDLGCRICTRKPVAAGDAECGHEQTSSSHSSNSRQPGRTLDRTDRLEPPDNGGEGLVNVAGSCRGLTSPGSSTEFLSQSNGVSSDVRRVVCIPNRKNVLSSTNSPRLSSPPLPSVVSGVSCGSRPPVASSSFGSTVAKRSDETVSRVNSDATSVCREVDVCAGVSSSSDVTTKNDSSFCHHQSRLSASSDVSGKVLTVMSIAGPPNTARAASTDLPGASSINAAADGKMSTPVSLLSPLVLPSGVVWRGVISAQDGANTIRVSAHRLSGSMKIVRDLLPSTIFMMGRIAPQMVQQYLQKIRGQHTLSHEISVICFYCDDDNEQRKYNHLFGYLEQKRRCGVINGVNASIKDMYLWPLLATADIPAAIVPPDRHEFQPSQSNLLLGIIVHQAKQSNSNNFRKLLPGTVQQEKIPFTQNPNPRTPSGQNVIEEETPTAEGASNNESSEEEDDDDDDDFRAIADSDPIVSKYSKVKRNDDSLQIPATCGDEDVPYDPFEAEYEVIAVNQVKPKVVDEEIEIGKKSNTNMTAFVDNTLATDSFRTTALKAMPSSTDILCSSRSSTTVDPQNDVSAKEFGTLPYEPELETPAMKPVFSPGVHSSSRENLLPAAKCVVDVEESREITTLSDANEHFSMLDNHNEGSVKTGSDIDSSSKLLPESGFVVSDLATDSKSFQERLTRNTLDGSSVVGFDTADGSQAKVRDVKSAISELFRVDVLNEDSLRKYLGQLMDSCGARTSSEQQKILIELIDTVEKASDVANAKTDCNSELSTEIQRNRSMPVLGPKVSNSSQGVLAHTWYERSESKQFGGLGNVERADLQCPAPDGRTVSAAEPHSFSTSGVLPDQNCNASFQTGIQSLRWEELASPSQHQQRDDGHFRYPNESSIAENWSQDRYEKQTDVASSCSRPSHSEEPQTLPTIPSDLSSINIENILPILSDSSVETLKTIIMSAKSVANLGKTATSAHPTHNPSQSSGFSLSSDGNLCVSSSGFSSRVGNDPDSFSAVDSSGLSGCRQFGNSPPFLPKDCRPDQLLPSLGFPPLFDGTPQFRASFPDQYVRHRAPSELCSVRQSEPYSRRCHLSNIAPCHHKPPMDPTISRAAPHMPYLRNPMPWQSCGPCKRSDGAITHNSIKPSLLNRFPDVCRSLGNPPLPQFRSPSSEHEFCPFSQNNGGQTRHSLHGVRNTAPSADSCGSFLGSSTTGNANYCDKQNLIGKSSLNPLHVCDEDAKFQQLNDAGNGGRGSDFNSTFFENFSDNSYEFLGSSSGENLEKILPLAALLNSTDSLDRNVGPAMLHCSQQRTDVNMDGERAEIIRTRAAPGSDSRGCSVLGHQFVTGRTVGAARETVDEPRNDADFRLSDREISWNSSGNYLSTGSRLDFLEPPNLPGCSFRSSSESQFRSCDGKMDVAGLKCTKTGEFRGSDGSRPVCACYDCQTAGEMELPGHGCALHSQRQSHGREIVSDVAAESSSVAGLSRSHHRGRFLPHFPDIGRRRRGLDSENDSCESHIFCKQDGCLSDCRGRGNSTRRPGSYRQDSDRTRQTQDFSLDGCSYKRRRLDSCDFDGDWSHLHRSGSDGVGYEEAHCHSSLDSRISMHEHGHEGLFGAVPGRQSLCHPNEDSDRLVARPQVVDYGHRKQKYLEDQGVHDIRRRLCDIAKGRGGGGDTCQNRTTSEARGRQTVSNERFPISETVDEDCRLSAFSCETQSGVLYKDLEQARKTVGSRVSSHEPALLGNRGTVSSHEEHLNMNTSERLRTDYCSNRPFHSKHFDPNSALNPNGEQTFDENRPGTVDDRIEVIDRASDAVPYVTKDLLAYLKSPDAFPSMQN